MTSAGTPARIGGDKKRLLTGLVAFLVLLANPALARQKGTVVVAAKTSLLRLEPSAEARIILKTERGAEFTVTGSTSGLMKVAISSGGEGWLPKAEVGLKVNKSGRLCVEMSLKDALTVGAVDGVLQGTGCRPGTASR